MLASRDAFTIMRDMGLFEYGSGFKASILRDICEIEQPYDKNYRQIKEITLQELSFAGYFRDQLLNEGKYLKGVGDNYRVLLPSENEGQVLSYMASANGKLKKAMKLNKNTPSEYKIRTQDEIRLILKQDEIKSSLKGENDESR